MGNEVCINHKCISNTGHAGYPTCMDRSANGFNSNIWWDYRTGNGHDSLKANNSRRRQINKFQNWGETIQREYNYGPDDLNLYKWNLCGGSKCRYETHDSTVDAAFTKQSKKGIYLNNKFTVFHRTSKYSNTKAHCNKIWLDENVSSKTRASLLKKCKLACYNTHWCKSFDMHRRKGRCYLSDKTESTGTLKSSKNYDYYEKKPKRGVWKTSQYIGDHMYKEFV